MLIFKIKISAQINLKHQMLVQNKKTFEQKIIVFDRQNKEVMIDNLQEYMPSTDIQERTRNDFAFNVSNPHRARLTAEEELSVRKFARKHKIPGFKICVTFTAVAIIAAICDFIGNSWDAPPKVEQMDPSTLPYEVVIPVLEQRWRPSSNVSDIDTGIWSWHNKLRSDPRSLISTLENMKDKFQGLNYNNGERMTVEGQDAVQSLIDYLRYKQPLQPLKWDQRIADAAKDHVMDIGPRGSDENDGQNGDSTLERI